MTGPLSRSLSLAAVEEEEITPETAAALDRGRASLARGEGIAHEEVRGEFGLEK
jgi:predicted transcriptional regulator